MGVQGRVVFIPKCRRKTLYGRLRKRLGKVFRQQAQRKECETIDGYLMPDPVHTLIAIPSKYPVSQVVRYIKEEECDSHA